jgi:hypothetical protein
MTAVLNGFRERAEKVAAVIAECRRLGIEVRPPDVQRSHALFTVETDAVGHPEAIRFGLAAIKNVGEGAIEAITAARDGGEEPGPFRSLDDLCRRVDVRTVNKRVVESLIKANALSSLGTPGALLARLDVALEAGARHQRDVAAGQGTLFDLFGAPPADGADGVAATEFLDDGEEIPRRERLRWEKELIGLYLSEHPLGDIVDQLPEYVTAYTGDLADESDQSKVTRGGIILTTRRVVTRAGSTMLVATLEDLQGSIEVVVFPNVFAETANSWADDSRVLVTGRVDHRDDTTQLLCEAIHVWEDAVRMGASAFRAERDRLLRARGGRENGYGGANGNGYGNGTNGNGFFAQGGSANAARTAVPVTPPAPVPVSVGSVSPVIDAYDADEPAAPREAVPLQAVPRDAAARVSVVFPDGAAAERLLAAIDSVAQALRRRPGPLPVMISIPVAGATRQVLLPERVSWDDRIGEQVRRAAGGLSVAVELDAGGGPA